MKINEILELDNIAEELEEEKLQEIAMDCLQGFEADESSRSEREDVIKKAMDFALQISEEKSYPFPKSSNIIFPLITDAAMGFAARAYPAIVQGNSIVKAKIIGSDIETLQPDITDSPIPPMMTQQAAPIQQQAPPTGAMQAAPPQEPQITQGKKAATGQRIEAHMNYQLFEEIEGWEIETDKLLHVLPIVGCCFRKTLYDPSKNKIVSEIIYPQYLYVNASATSLEKAPRITQVYELYRNELVGRQRKGIFREVELEGHTPSSEEGEYDSQEPDYTTPHEILEQHTWIDLDDDGYEEPYIVTIHKSRGEVLRIDARYTQESIELNEEGDVAEIKPEHYFTKYSFIPASDGSFYDIGWGELLLPINSAINGIINQLVDAGHLSNAPRGLVGTGIRMKGGSLKLKPNQYDPVNSIGQNIANSIYTFPTSQPSPVLFQLLDFLVSSGRSIATVQNIMQDVPANAPATTAMAQVEQGLQQFKAIYKRVYHSLKSEFKKIYRLNELFLDEETYIEINGQPDKISSQDYAVDRIDVVPVADVDSVSDMQKTMKAQFLMTFMENPLVKQDEILRRIFDSMQIPDVDALITQPPPPAPDPMMQINMEIAGAQLDLLKAQEEKIQNDIILDREEAVSKGLETGAIINKRNAEAVDEIASAEQREAGTQLDQYVAQLQGMKAYDEGTQRQIPSTEQSGKGSAGTVGDMASSSGNAGTLQSPVVS